MKTATAKKPKETPTPAQLKVLVAVHLHIKTAKIAPSLEEIQNSLKVNQSAIWQALKRLKRDGFLVTRDGTKYRNLMLTPVGKKAASAFLRENEHSVPPIAVSQPPKPIRTTQHEST